MLQHVLLAIGRGRGGLPIEWVLVALGVVAVGSIASWAWRRSQKNKKKVRRAPTCTIADLVAKGTGRVSGDVKPIGEKTVTSPLTGRTCVFYTAKVEHEVGGAWKVLVHESHGVPFHLVDDSGKALVDPDTATVELDLVAASGDLAKPNEAREEFVKRHDLPTTNTRYSESILEAGQRVTAIASAAKTDGGDVVHLGRVAVDG
jgi:E3 ubiquitin ligase